MSDLGNNATPSTASSEAVFEGGNENKKAQKENGSEFLNIVISVIFSVFITLFAVHYYLGTQGHTDKPVYISVDFEQAALDVKAAGIKVDGPQWIYSKVEEVCKTQQCLVFGNGSVMGGDVLDMNELLRKTFSIAKAEKPKTNVDELLNIFQGFKKGE